MVRARVAAVVRLFQEEPPAQVVEFLEEPSDPVSLDAQPPAPADSVLVLVVLSRPVVSARAAAALALGFAQLQRHQPRTECLQEWHSRRQTKTWY